MNIGVIGGGSIGLLASGYLSRTHSVTLYVKREEQKKKFDTHQLQIINSSESYNNLTINVQQISDLNDEACFLICVKQGNLNEIIPFLENIPSHTPLLFLQNGMGHIHKIEKLPHPIYLGSVDHGARRVNDYQVEHLGKGKIRLASFSGNKEELINIINALNSNLFPIEMVDNWKILLVNKLIINAVINPLTALFDVPNRSIVENEYIHYLAKNLCKEAASVLGLNEEAAWQRIQEVAINTGLNTSSMRADIKQYRQTEIEAITGYILENSDTDLPYTSFIYHSILAIQRERVSHS